ncbi:DJ-1/PfpI family protein [Sedimentitalea sp.]|uniref:DJ-1/PfpI family protein n=1 Tax=Sedimentitalea sp. TaxID=2048915 RepID=UPI003299D8E1
MSDLKNTNILIMSTNGFEQSELIVPLEKLKAAGATVHVATPDGNAITGWQDGNWGDSVDADLKISDVDVDNYIALVLPGGQMNPDCQRRLESRPRGGAKVGHCLGDRRLGKRAPI